MRFFFCGRGFATADGSRSEFVLFHLEANSILLGSVCNWRRNRFIMNLFCRKKYPKYLSEIHKKVSEITLSEILWC